MLKVESPRELSTHGAIGLNLLHRYAIAKHLILCFVGLQQRVADKDLFQGRHGFGAFGLGKVLVQFNQRVHEIALEKDVLIGVTTQRTTGAENLIVEAVMDVPPHATKQLALGLLDSLLFGVTAGHSLPPSRVMASAGRYFKSSGIASLISHGCMRAISYRAMRESMYSSSSLSLS